MGQLIGIVCFYTEVLRRSVSEGISLSQSISWVLVVLLAITGLLAPRLLSTQKIHKIQNSITVGRLLIVIVLVLVIATVPFAIYDMWQEEHNRALKIQGEKDAIQWLIPLSQVDLDMVF